MAVTANVTGSSGTTIYIGPAAGATVDTQTEFEALTYVEIGGAETVGKFGDEATSVKFTALTDSRVRKNKGPRDAGMAALVCGYDAADPGQQALEDAEQTNQKFAFKVVFPDAVDENHSNTVVYFRALVQSAPFNVGGAQDTIRREYNLDVDSALVVVPTALISP